MNLMKYRFGKENIKKYQGNISRQNISNKLMILGSDRKKKNRGKKPCLKRIRGFDTGEEVGGSRHSLAR